MCKNLLVSNFSRKPQKLTLVMSLNPVSAGHKTYYVFMLTFFKKILCLCLFLLYFIIVRVFVSCFFADIYSIFL